MNASVNIYSSKYEGCEYVVNDPETLWIDSFLRTIKTGAARDHQLAGLPFVILRGMNLSTLHHWTVQGCSLHMQYKGILSPE